MSEIPPRRDGREASFTTPKESIRKRNLIWRPDSHSLRHCSRIDHEKQHLVSSIPLILLGMLLTAWIVLELNELFDPPPEPPFSAPKDDSIPLF